MEYEERDRRGPTNGVYMQVKNKTKQGNRGKRGVENGFAGVCGGRIKYKARLLTDELGVLQLQSPDVH